MATTKDTAESAAVSPIDSRAAAIDFPASVHATLSEQLSKMGEAMAIVRMSAATVREVYEDCDSTDGMPIDSALRGAHRMLDDIFAELVALEESAKAGCKEAPGEVAP